MPPRAFFFAPILREQTAFCEKRHGIRTNRDGLKTIYRGSNTKGIKTKTWDPA